MPQEFHVLRCYSCSVFQVHIVKKSNKWQCKMCNEKQSLKKVYGVGTGKDCRLHVQKLNSSHLAEQEKPASFANQLSTVSSHCESPSQYLASAEYEEQESVHDEPENSTTGQSKWARYIEVKPQQESESDSEEPLYFEKPTKRRKFQPQSELDKKCPQQEEPSLPSKSVLSQQQSQRDTRATNAASNSNFSKGKWGKYVQSSENDTRNLLGNSTEGQDSPVRKYSVQSPSVDDNIPQESFMFEDKEDNCADYSKSSSSKTSNRWSKYLDNFPQPQNSTATVNCLNFLQPSYSEPETSNCKDKVETSTKLKQPINFSIANEELSDEELDNLLQL